MYSLCTNDSLVCNVMYSVQVRVLPWQVGLVDSRAHRITGLILLPHKRADLGSNPGVPIPF